MSKSNKRKVRSKSWVATEHIVGVGIFTLFFTWLISMLLGSVIILLGVNQDVKEQDALLLQMILIQCSSVVGVVAATYYSMSRIRKTCIMYDPPSYISPCIAAGIIMIVVSLALRSLICIMSEQYEVLIISVISHGIAYIAYATVTRRSFTNMPPDAYPKKQSRVMPE